MARKWTDAAVATGTSVAAGDLILTVSDPTGTPVSKKITVQNLMDSDSVREAIRDHLGDVVIQGGANVTVTHDDPSDTITVAVTSLDNAPVGATTPSTGSFTVNTVDQLVFDIAAAIESDTAGEMSWDVDAETVMLALDDQIHMHIGQDSFYHVINQTGSDIPKGTGVYATGTVGNSGKITVAPFTADGTFNSKYFMGVTAEVIANGATGFVVHFGKLRKIDTTDFEEGDILFADPSVAGGLTNVKPDAPNNIITVAIVVTKSETVGELFVRPTFIDGFADNEDVTVTSATTGDLLRYNGTIWVNYPDSNFASATGLSTHIADTTNPHSVTKTQVGLGNVENTALSTWAGSTNITTLGTITTGTWNGDTIASAYIGSHTHAASDVTSGTFADARIAQTNVTQHQAALSITESQISDFGSYQPLDSGLTSIAGLPTIADKMLYTTASDTYSTTTLTSFARSILDDADAATVRTTIGVDAAGTDNSTDVTLAGTYDYLTLSGQQITLGQIDLSTDVTGTLPSGNIGSHTHVASDITDFSEAVDDRSASLLTAGTDISITYNDEAGTLTVAYTGTSGATSLDGLTDVNAPTPSTGDLIRWSGTEWATYADSNYAAASHTHAASDVTSGTFADARIAQSNVTQHQAALSITESQISDLGTYQTQDAGLTSIAGLTTAADKMLYTTASDTYAVTDLTSFARSILDDADAATVRTTIGVDAAGTDNSTDVTLAGAYDYLTIAGQVITLGQVDLTTDVAGTLPIANGGTGATTAAAARTALDVDQAGTDNSTNVTLATVAGNYLTIVGQEITAGTVPVSLGGTGATTAAGARTALDVDQAGTDNSTDVTIAAGLDYITISGQQLTLGSVDLTTDVTGTLPIANGGTGATTAAGARAALDVDQAGTDNSTDVTLAGTYDYLTLSGQQITLGQIDLTTDVTGVLPSGNIGTHTHATSDITSGTFADARIAESNVTQHQAALSITESQISDFGTYVDEATALVYAIVF